MSTLRSIIGKPIHWARRRVAGAPPARQKYPADFEAHEIDTIQAVEPFTMTTPERIVSLCRAVAYVVENDIPGDIVECGVWRGGSMMAVARTLLRVGRQDRDLYLFDTFEGMTKPTDKDVSFRGNSALTEWEASESNGQELSWKFAAGLQQVRETLNSTGYDQGKTHLVSGKVEQTIPEHAPQQIALLRLDTDWYESTWHEMEHLFPRLTVGGVIIIDDYGHWAGARKAVDDYLRSNGVRLLLNRIDYTGRIAVKCEAVAGPKQ